MLFKYRICLRSVINVQTQRMLTSATVARIEVHVGQDPADHAVREQRMG